MTDLRLLNMSFININDSISIPTGQITQDDLIRNFCQFEIGHLKNIIIFFAVVYIIFEILQHIDYKSYDIILHEQISKYEIIFFNIVCITLVYYSYLFIYSDLSPVGSKIFKALCLGIGFLVVMFCIRNIYKDFSISKIEKS